MNIKSVSLVAVLLWGTFSLPCYAQVEWVDPTIGGVGTLLQPTRPTVHLPNSMVRMYPLRKDQLDDQIRAFPLTIISHRNGELFSVMPGEDAKPAAWDQEETTPYYYSTRFDESLIRTEFTPTERCGFFRFTFPKNEAPKGEASRGEAVVRIANLYPGNLKPLSETTFGGEEQFVDMKAYVYGQWSQAAEMEVSGQDKKRLKIHTDASSLELRYGISFISVDQAKRNLEKEIAASDFETIKQQAKSRWNTVLGQIQAEGGTDAQRRVFYTSLYRTYERMICVTEDGRYYSASDHQVHQDDRPFYVDNWIWDSFRAHQPLHTLLNPEMQADQIQSYVRMYEQSGWMPSFAILWGDNPCMNGNHAAGWIADCLFKGVKDFDLEKAYDGLRKNSLEATLLPWRNGPKCSLDDFYHEHGYFPSLPPEAKETEPLVHHFENRQSVAVTLGTAYDDWCIAQLAKTLDKKDDYDRFMKRADFYKNVWNSGKGFMWPKDAEGNWVEPFDPKFGGGQGGRAYFDENNAFTYNWDVLHDFDGLFELMGGREAAEAKLDQLFREGLDRSKYEFWFKYPDSTGLVGQFVMGNEPSFSTPYLYNRMGSPWKTQKRIRSLLNAWFNDTIHGIPGDEDGGGMTAWVVFSMMGFYPVTPGIPTYDLGSPIFDRVQIQMPGGKTFKIIAKDNSVNNKYIQSVKLNGKAIDQVWFHHADIANGGTLELQMGNTPGTFPKDDNH
ncbi:Glycosyl hydrolase family 92 [Planctomycetes bacterium CA13]|uniref:Glycosyl hydrolase family 92 n=1 Tax=Novipirellula herctigrandis TaxID=2527986 RepID=A0A5C5Z8H7_9BACT|nr:Glycosyl hydrolase family 92 [Planctomycetes bacterium CA13]